MTGEKRTETRMRCYNTLCIPYISLHPSLHACIVYDCREGRGVIYREYTECYSISFLFFSPVIPISYQNICKMFLFTSDNILACILILLHDSSFIFSYRWTSSWPLKNFWSPCTSRVAELKINSGSCNPTTQQLCFLNAAGPGSQNPQSFWSGLLSFTPSG